MPPRLKRVLAPVSLITLVAASALVANACRNAARSGSGQLGEQLKSEPEQYSSTVVRTIVDGARLEEIVTKEARSGDQRREEWTEQGRTRALILRLDLGKNFLLDPDRQLYVEKTPSGGGENIGDDFQMQDRASAESISHLVQAVDRAIDDAPSPDRVETRELPPQQVDGYLCRVYEQRSTFPDGHAEITKMFRAADLRGLALRTESYSEPASVRIMTERKDVRMEVQPDAFTVPANFRRVDNLDTSSPATRH